MANTHADLVFLRLIIPLVAGILLFYPVSSMLVLIIISTILILIIGVLAYLNHCYARLISFRIKPYITGCFYLLSFMVGGWATMLNKEILRSNHFSKTAANYLEVVINEEPQIRSNTLRFPVKVVRSIHKNYHKSVVGHLMISINVKERYVSLRYGDQLLIPANFKSIAAPRNPYEFDAKAWYNQQNIHHQAYLQPEQFLIEKSNQGNPIVSWALDIRKTQVNLFRRLLKQDEAYTVASTLILGYRAELSEETLMAYSKTGTIHALSVSGMHVGLIYLIINFLLSFLDKWKSGRLIKFVLSICLIWLYALIAGLTPSVLRSALMLSVFIIANTFKRNKNSYNLLAFSAFCILIYNPLLIYDVGFQLSYLSVFGLIYLQPYINAWFNFKNYWAHKLWEFLALSLAAQLATFPLATYYFHQFPLYFLLSNLFILLPVSLIMYLGLLITICPIDIFSSSFEWLLKFTNNGLKWIASLPYASISKIWFSKAELFLLSASILFLCIALRRFNKRLMILGLTCMTLLSISLAVKHFENAQQRRIIFFSIQKGSVIAFIDKRCAWIYSPLKPESKVMKYYVLPALDQAGVTSFNYLTPHGSLKKPQIRFENHQISFFSYKILLADSCFNDKTLNNPLKFDAITLSKEANLNLKGILKNLKVKTIFVDAGSAEYRTERYKNVAKHFNLSIYDLRIKKAYLVNLKK